MKDSKRDKVCGCLNCGHKHSEIKAQVGTVLYCKDCNKYEHIVHISEAGISTSERLEREELFQLLSEGRVRIVDDDDMKDNGLSVSNWITELIQILIKLNLELKSPFSLLSTDLNSYQIEWDECYRKNDYS